MAVSNIIERTIDIDAGVIHEDLRRLFAVADAQAHTFKITVTSKGSPQSLSGHTVVGYFMTNYHGTVVIAGSVSGNTATLVLPAACYAYNTGFQLIIRLVSGSTKTAIYWGSGYVTRSSTSPEIDPGSVVPDIDDLLAMLDQMDQATQAANTAAADANEAASKSIRYDTVQSLTGIQKAQAQSNIGFFSLSGHSWSVMGDSISQDGLYVNKQYWDFISERYEGMTIYNYGISAQRITQFASRYQSMHYSDIITVFGGVNDWGQSNPTPLGEISDNTISTFYGALNILCSGILSAFPKSLVVFITPLGNNGFSGFPVDENSLGLTVYDYANAIKVICSKYKIPVVDACSASLLNPQIQALNNLYFYDGLHLSVAGHEVLARMLEAEMLNHYIPNLQQDEDFSKAGVYITLNDTENALGFTNLAISDGTFEYSAAASFSCAPLKTSISKVRCKFRNNDAFTPWFVFNKVNNSKYYCTDGNNMFVFEKNGNAYTAAKDNTLATITTENYSTFSASDDIVAYLENGNLKIKNALGGKITITNSNVIGWWTDSTPTPTRHLQFVNATILE